MAIAFETPPLAPGDHLSRAEFLRRQAALPAAPQAELVEGVVFMVPPVRDGGHAAPHADILAWLSLYRLATPSVVLSVDPTLHCDAHNVFQPDAVLRLSEQSGGQARLTADDYLTGAPELIVEIAGSSAAQDLHEKRSVYERIGVAEYLVWQVYERRLDWFLREDGCYQPQPPSPSGVWRSRVFPGLVLDAAALLRGDLPAVAARLQQALCEEEHAAFVRRVSPR